MTQCEGARLFGAPASSPLESTGRRRGIPRGNGGNYTAMPICQRAFPGCVRAWRRLDFPDENRGRRRGDACVIARKDVDNIITIGIGNARRCPCAPGGQGDPHPVENGLNTRWGRLFFGPRRQSYVFFSKFYRIVEARVVIGDEIFVEAVYSPAWGEKEIGNAESVHAVSVCSSITRRKASTR